MTNLLEIDAIHYKDHSKSQYSQAGSLIKLIDIKENFSVLDVGCGYGKIISELSLMLPKGKAIGVDASNNMIALAKSTFPSHIYKNLKFLHTVAEEMQFHKNSFDLITCTNVFMWIRKPKKVLGLMSLFLKPNGKIIIFSYPKTTPYALLFEKVLIKFFPELEDKSAVKTMLSPIEYKEALIQESLEIRVFEIEDVVFSYEDTTDFKNYVRGWLSCYVPVSEEDQEIFLEKLCEQASQDGYCNELGRISIPHQTLKIVAHKPNTN